MDRIQAKNFIKIMAASYQSFAPTPPSCPGFLKRLNNHIRTSRFPPSIAEILNPDEANRKFKKPGQEGDSPAAIMFGYEIYDPVKH